MFIVTEAEKNYVSASLRERQRRVQLAGHEKAAPCLQELAEGKVSEMAPKEQSCSSHHLVRQLSCCVKNHIPELLSKCELLFIFFFSFP